MEMCAFSDFRCNSCDNVVQSSYINLILDRAARDVEAMDKSDENQCIRYFTKSLRNICSITNFVLFFAPKLFFFLLFFSFIKHYSKWLPPNHFYICDVELTLTQAIGSGDPRNLQLASDERLQMKIDLCQKLLKLFAILAAGT